MSLKKSVITASLCAALVLPVKSTSIFVLSADQAFAGNGNGNGNGNSQSASVERTNGNGNVPRGHIGDDTPGFGHIARELKNLNAVAAFRNGNVPNGAEGSNVGLIAAFQAHSQLAVSSLEGVGLTPDQIDAVLAANPYAGLDDTELDALAADLLAEIAITDLADPALADLQNELLALETYISTDPYSGFTTQELKAEALTYTDLDQPVPADLQLALDTSIQVDAIGAYQEADAS